jgi:GNAT superfamily N-acetyltransferase
MEEVGTPDVSMVVIDTADKVAEEVILQGLTGFNRQMTGLSDQRPLAVLLKDSSASVTGGLWGATGYGWLFVQFLYVPEPLRGRGFGSALLLRAEAEALARGCRGVWLNTFEFQARGFYERMGYECFGELADYPVGFSRYFMRKALSPTPGGDG